jgi:GT2 family glycosyltransferase
MGGLDEKFQVAYEDVDFAHRLKQKKNYSIFVIDAAVCHPWRTLKQEGNNWKRNGYELESLALFLNKHPDAYSSYGSTLHYLRNFCRILTKDLSICLFNLHGRGIDVLFLQALNTLRTILFLIKLPTPTNSKI